MYLDLPSPTAHNRVHLGVRLVQVAQVGVVLLGLLRGADEDPGAAGDAPEHELLSFLLTRPAKDPELLTSLGWRARPIKRQTTFNHHLREESFFQ